MKVSKVEHTWTAVIERTPDSKKENTNIGGILYKNPTKQKKSQITLLYLFPKWDRYKELELQISA